MFELLKDYVGPLVVNNEKYDTVKQAEKDFHKVSTGLTILINPRLEPEKKNDAVKVYEFVFKKYMTTFGPEFFLYESNNGVRLPFVNMLGTVIKETKSLLHLNLFAGMVHDRVTKCMRCGRPISEAVLQRIGIGSECDGLNYIDVPPKDIFKDITWQGWLPKNQIISQTELKGFLRCD